ncbi:MAG: selenide, water dikinase SelD [Sulfurimonas sp.]|jgi:selenide,water dikinase|uniref:selenide, water dikinase SelD n=1 Tax=unclassified Sulfurimonas TaxID=2623549 RepID=UPI0008D84BBA|nr:selenide, water dikinase SelD [Sulfurimonas sp. RIFOXYB12_FULL_35_9]MBS4069125.1 selenide, water dikinase SelD [Sulfurimonas sp.]OHE03357.1 MAG: selenide, water dikinase SelD [Sulfurimonas sp. RIFOXYB12_FULL_35_9]
MQQIKLTEYSHGAGCGCKISPMLLEEILKDSSFETFYPELLVGNEHKDDAAAFDLGNGTSVLSTTDFFMPIVDDPFTFGRIAATNALSDIYAMGGTPLMAIAIFGWPIDKLSAEVAREVIEGGRAVCRESGIPLAGGHSIDSPEPIFGLAVTGLAENKNLMMNRGAKEDCFIFITKPIGIGILTTAQKQKKIEATELEAAIEAMVTLNKIGLVLAPLESVATMTDVTGFGLLGHLSEVCEASNISAKIYFDKVPLLPNVEKYRAMGCIAGGSRKNFLSYGNKISTMTQQQQEILCDPQTSGGLLVFVKKDGAEEFYDLIRKMDLTLEPIGETISKGIYAVEVL